MTDDDKYRLENLLLTTKVWIVKGKTNGVRKGIVYVY